MGHQRPTGLITFPQFPRLVSNDPINSGLVGAWLFNEGGGSIARDLTGLSNGSLVNYTTSQWVPGVKPGPALAFDGTSQYVSVTSAAFSSMPSVSFSGWIYQPTRADGWTPWFNTTDLISGFFFGKFSDGSPLLYIGGSSATGALPSTYPIGQWFHVAISVAYFNGSATLVTAWVNGIKGGTVGGGVLPAETAFQIAANTANNYYSNCTISNFRIWNRAITAREAQRLYENPYSGLTVPHRLTARAGSAPTFTWSDLSSQQVPIRPKSVVQIATQWGAVQPLPALPVNVASFYQPLSKPSLARRSVATQLEPIEPISISPETVSVDKWLQGLSQPYFTKRALTANQLEPIGPVSLSPEAVSVDKWLQALSQPYPTRRSVASQLEPVEPIVVSTPEVITVDKWFQNLSQPYPSKRGLGTSDQQEPIGPISLNPETVSVDKWLQGLSQPYLTRGLSAANQIAFAWGVTTPPPPAGTSEDRWHQPFTQPYPVKRGLAAADQMAYTAPVSEAPETVTVDRWLQALSTPSVARRAVQPPVTPPPVVDVPQGWDMPLSTPTTRRRVAQDAWAAPVTVTTSPVVPSFGWFMPLVDPQRSRGPHASQAIAYTGVVVVAPVAPSQMGWFTSLNEPPRRRPAVISSDQTEVLGSTQRPFFIGPIIYGRPFGRDAYPTMNPPKQRG